MKHAFLLLFIAVWTLSSGCASKKVLLLPPEVRVAVVGEHVDSAICDLKIASDQLKTLEEKIIFAKALSYRIEAEVTKK